MKHKKLEQFLIRTVNVC